MFARIVLVFGLLVPVLLIGTEDVEQLERTIRNFEYRAKMTEQEARRVQVHDRGHAMYLRRHAKWLRARAEQMRHELDAAKQVREEKSPGS